MKTKLIYDTVIFDMDGTLLDSAPGIIKTIHEVFNELNISFPEMEDESRLIGPPLKYVYHHMLGLDMVQLEKAISHHHRYYMSHGIFETTLFPGVRELMRDLKLAGAKVGVATSKYYQFAEKLMDHFGLEPYIDLAEMSNGTEMTSTKENMIATIMSSFKSKAERTVMIGDTIYDAEGARLNAISFIAVLYGYGTHENMQKAKVMQFANTVNELRPLLFSDLQSV